MQVLDNALASLALAQPQAFSNLAVHPLLGSLPGRAADYLVLDEALARQAARVTEVSEGGSVPELAFHNEGDVAVLLLHGEELVGARQNRVLNTTVLVGGGRKVPIPVSCVEQGRWSYNSPEFSSADRALFVKARAKQVRQVSAALRDSGRYSADQREVWADIAEKSARFNSRSPTDAMSEVFEQQRQTVDAYVDAIPAMPGQCGAVFAIDGKIVGLEYFDTAATFAHYLPKLVRSYALDAVETVASGPNSHLPPVEEVVRQFIKDLLSTAAERFPGVGEGENMRLESETLAGSALVLGERVIHCAAFKSAAAHRGAQLAPSRLSRARRVRPPRIQTGFSPDLPPDSSPG